MDKICTSIEQSQKLIEIGIDIDTADMYWWYYGKSSEKIYYVGTMNDNEFIKASDIPAWSFTALFNMLPKSARLEKGSSSELCQINLPIELKCSDWYLNPIDAVFEIICVLKKEEYI